MEPLKNVYSRSYVERLACEVKKAHHSFDIDDFTCSVLNSEWEDMELKQRMAHLTVCLHKHLKLPYAKALEVLIECAPSFTGFGFFFPDYVEKFGLEHWLLSMKALAELTKHSTSEFAIRPFIRLDEIKAMKQMLKWSTNKNEHIRRLASEGCRPRLPWSGALVSLVKNPAAIVPILENLIKDESLYVRKSVANNLNDISKDHPDLAISLAKRWYKNGNNYSQWIVKHGMRTLLKSGHSEALNIFGYAGAKNFKKTSFIIKTPLVLHNDYLEVDIEFEVKKKSVVRLEYALHFLLKNGKWGRKVFKVSEKESTLETNSFSRRHHFKSLTTRSYNEGIHAFELILNGHSFGIKPFIYQKQSSPYQVYILQTERGTFYSGVATDVNRRFLEHLGINKGGAKFTRAQKPHALLYLEIAKNRSEAQKRESAIKKLSRKKKEELINHSFWS